MAWILDSDRPIYMQLVERIQTEIVSGKYPPGSRLPSVRDLAAEATVNPNTMQKAYAELERLGLIITWRTNGRTVTEDTALLSETRYRLAAEHMTLFLQNMKKLGYREADIQKLIADTFKEGLTNE